MHTNRTLRTLLLCINCSVIALSLAETAAAQSCNTLVAQESISEEDRVQAAANFKMFAEHYGNLLAGHSEGIYLVRVDGAVLRDGPSQMSPIIGELKQNADVHVIAIEGDWAKIGRRRYVLLENLRSAGIRTPGAEAYQYYQRK